MVLLLVPVFSMPLLQDVPACMEYVLKHSPCNADKLHWIGHSMVSDLHCAARSQAVAVSTVTLFVGTKQTLCSQITGSCCEHSDVLCKHQGSMWG
jgi:hypothetical protein